MDSPVRRQKRFQSALRKFQCFTGSLWEGTLNLGVVMREGQCFDHGNFPWTRLSGSQLSWPRLAKARSADVPTAREETGCFLWVVQQSKVVGCCPGVQALTVRGCCVVTLVDVLAIEVTNVQAGVWERQDGTVQRKVACTEISNNYNPASKPEFAHYRSHIGCTVGPN